MWLPDTIYKALPSVYLTGGVVAMVYADNIVGYGAGLLLISGSLAIFKIRKDAKASVAEGRRRPVAGVRIRP